ncbi:hypothetical protein SAMN04488498_113117 [Mesorhizobium albiziae]|uniref:Homeodomain-like domain-containing protein n=1 Tax=Neomesorhizobium albiziae TaxID=335020 RepID=A0A1I4CN07_9HYPH|nr:hypothetical protein [Mesorhizobium albiziae]SFK81456.1 hypothetical protein SAMN04488498_113117 [Mesorhizobium albiziae]
MHGTLPPVRRARIVRRDNTWTFNESEILKEHWPDVSLLRKRLPHRSEKAIHWMAKRCGLISPKEQHIWTAAEHSKLRRFAGEGMTRKAIAAELGVTPEQVASRLLYTRINIAKQPPKLLGDPLVDAIRRRAFDMRMTMAELDRSLGRRKTFQSCFAGKRVSPAHIMHAVSALGGKMVIEWEAE